MRDGVGADGNCLTAEVNLDYFLHEVGGTDGECCQESTVFARFDEVMDREIFLSDFNRCCMHSRAVQFSFASLCKPGLC